MLQSIRSCFVSCAVTFGDKGTLAPKAFAEMDEFSFGFGTPTFMTVLAIRKVGQDI